MCERGAWYGKLVRKAKVPVGDIPQTNCAVGIPPFPSSFQFVSLATVLGPSGIDCVVLSYPSWSYTRLARCSHFSHFKTGNKLHKGEKQRERMVQPGNDNRKSRIPLGPTTPIGDDPSLGHDLKLAGVPFVIILRIGGVPTRESMTTT